MKFYLVSFIFLLLLFSSCDQKKEKKELIKNPSDQFVLAFGSCNNQHLKNPMWKEILKNDPDLFVWGGDIVYSDTQDMKFIRSNYEKQKNDSSYQYFIKQVPVIGTWDDHDYGVNDGGTEYIKKDSVQQIFLDFFDVAPSDKRRKKQGVYFTENIDLGNHSIKIIVLDTRYFRSALTKDPTGEKRYIPGKTRDGTMLGKEQWQWLKNELNNSNANFNIIISSVQFLSYEHGFESWGTMPNEVKKLKEIISTSKAKGVLILSGDRHIAEISKDSIPGMNYPLIDFTSSGLTHSYTAFKGEANRYRISKVIPDKNFGILKIDLIKNQVEMEIRGENDLLYESFLQVY